MFGYSFAFSLCYNAAKKWREKKALMRSYRRPVDDDGKLVLQGEKEREHFVGISVENKMTPCLE